MIPLTSWGPRSPSWQRSRRRAARNGEAPALAAPRPYPAHVGLWLDRKLAEEWSEEERGWLGRRELYQVAIDAFTGEAQATQRAGLLATYREAFQRFRKAVTDEQSGLCREVVELEATSRILLHPAVSESVTQGAVLLHHTYGVPYLPGSALKGLARSRLRAMAQSAEPELQRQLEGWADGLLGFLRDAPPKSGTGASSERPEAQAAVVEFLDALWVPSDGAQGAAPLALDLVNPHHPSYYTVQGDRRLPPTDGDNPNPVERLTVAPGARFLMVVETPKDLAPWLSWLVREVLLPALEEDGLGSWTSAGYGRLKAAGAAGAAAQPATGEVTWHPAHVAREPGRGELWATLDDERRAVARNDAVSKLTASLPEEVRKKLEGRRRVVRIEVRIVPEGTRFRLVALRPLQSP